VLLAGLVGQLARPACKAAAASNTVLQNIKIDIQEKAASLGQHKPFVRLGTSV
jgi:hypothetical protein